MDKDTKMSLIKGLLAGQLTKKQRRSYADLESVDRELKIQWNESENKAIDFKRTDLGKSKSKMCR